MDPQKEVMELDIYLWKDMCGEIKVNNMFVSKYFLCSTWDEEKQNKPMFYFDLGRYCRIVVSINLYYIIK